MRKLHCTRLLFVQACTGLGHNKEVKVKCALWWHVSDPVSVCVCEQAGRWAVVMDAALIWKPLKSIFTPSWETLTQISWAPFLLCLFSLLSGSHLKVAFVGCERSQYVSIELSADSAPCSRLHGIIYNDRPSIQNTLGPTVWSKRQTKWSTHRDLHISPQ